MRGRIIKPEFWEHEGLAELSRDHRLLFIGLWGLADREGRLVDRPRRIKGVLFRFDDDITGDDIDRLLGDLATHQEQFIVRYEVGGERLIQIRKFSKHQQINIREARSALPGPHGNFDAEHGNARACTETHVHCEDEHVHGVHENASTASASASASSSASDSPPDPDARAPIATAAPPDPPPRRTRRKPSTAEGFDEFYAAYPKRIDPDDAERAWRKVDPDDALRGQIMAGLERWVAHWAAENTKVKFIPAPSVWLNNARWRSDPPTGFVTGAAGDAASATVELDGASSALRETRAGLRRFGGTAMQHAMSEIERSDDVMAERLAARAAGKGSLF